MMTLSQEVLQGLHEYTSGNIGLDDFEAWFIPATLELHHTTDDDARDLVPTIKLWLAEFYNGDWTEGELREKFLGLSPRIELEPAEWLAASPASHGPWFAAPTYYFGDSPSLVWIPRIETEPVAA